MSTNKSKLVELNGNDSIADNDEGALFYIVRFKYVP